MSRSDHKAASLWPSWDLTRRQLNDLELLQSGAFSPLTGFLTRSDYLSVIKAMRLSDGSLWPIPITLDVTETFAERLDEGSVVALRDPEGVMLAALHVEDIWRLDREEESELVFGTTNPKHPGVDYVLNRSHPVYLGGRIESYELPTHYDFTALRHTPEELKTEFSRMGWTRIVAFHSSSLIHRREVDMTQGVARDLEANLLIHPVVGMTKPGDIDHFTRVRAYQHVLDRYPKGMVVLSLLPLAMRAAGPREALWHAIIRKNHGVTHFMVGPDHGGPDTGGTKSSFYETYAAQELLDHFESEIGVEAVHLRKMVYVPDRARHEPEAEVSGDTRTLSMSDVELKELLAEGKEVPDWFSYPDVVAELRKVYPARHEQGLTVFFTGLSGSGKSTLANALMVRLLEVGGRRVTLLDGDKVRKNLSVELGFSKEDRDRNILRIGFVASEITKHGGVAICAPIAPYDRARQQNRRLISEVGGYVLVHVSTPLEVCEERDRKGLYARARAGLIEDFTGISDPYEEPTDADLTIDTTEISPEVAVNQIMLHLESLGYFAADR